MTRRDAEVMVSELLDKGRRQRDSLLDELERLGKQLGKQSEALARQAREVTEKPLAKAERKLRRTAGSKSKKATAPAKQAKATAPAKAAPAKKAPAKAAPAKKAAAKAAPAKSTRFPIAGYDDLNATEIRKRLADLTPKQLEAVREREAAGAARKTVLSAIDKKLAAKA
jgi:hypothetical protein